MDIESELQKLKTLLNQGPNATLAYMNNLINTTVEYKSLNEFALRYLENLPDNADFISISKCGEIIELHCPNEELGRIERIRKNLPELKGLRDYRSDFDKLIKLIQSDKDQTCRCNIYSQYNTDTGHYYFKNIGEIQENTGYIPLLIMQCKHCLKKYLVEIDLGYHFTIYHWENFTE